MNKTTEESREIIEKEEKIYELAGVDPNDFEMRQKLGTYSIIFEHFDRDEWERFKSTELKTFLTENISKISLTKAIVLCERHPEYLHVFLNFFYKINQSQTSPKNFLPFLIQNVQKLPVRWISAFALQIVDVRYAHLFLIACFTNALKMTPHNIYQIRENQQTWENYVKEYQVPLKENYAIAWQKLLEYRTATQELVDYKIEFKLSDYLTCNKEDFVSRMIRQCENGQRLIKALKTQIIPYCQMHLVNVEKLISRTLSTANWDVKTKLKILTDFITAPTIKQHALNTMTFQDDDGLKEIKEYAKQNNFQYDPDPIIFAKCMESKKRKVTRSLSMFLETPRNKTPVKTIPIKSFVPKSDTPRSDCWKRSPSIDLSLASGGSLGNYANIANGSPSNPEEYAEKLSKFRNLKEIRPIYDLAKTYEIVVSYDDFIDGKQKIFDKLIERDGWNCFSIICSVLALDPAETIAYINENNAYIEDGAKIFPNIANCIKRGNSKSYIEFVSKCMRSMQATKTIKEISEICISCLQASFHFIEAGKIDYYVMLAHILNSLESISNKEMQRTVLKQYTTGTSITDIESLMRENGEDAAADELFPIITEYSVDDFINDFTSNDIKNVAKAVIQVRSLYDETETEYLKAAIEKVNGTEYSLLSYLYQILEEAGNKKSETETNVLALLYTEQKHNIDFHDLMKDPKTTLENNVTIENIWSILPLCNFLEQSQDDLIIYFIIHKMTSPCFDDYRDLLSALHEKKDHQDLIQTMSSRLNKEDLALLFNSLGMVNETRKIHTLLDLNVNNLSEFATGELLDDPKKLIHELYCKQQTRDSLGRRLHKVCDKIAMRYELDPKAIRNSIFREWLEAPYPELKEDCEALFGETTDEVLNNADNTAVQSALFILRTRTTKDAIHILNKFMLTAPPRPKARAICCILGIADEEDITKVCGNVDELDDIYTRSLLCAHAEAYGLHASPEDFTREKIDETIKDYDTPWANLINFAVKFPGKGDTDTEEMKRIIIKLSQSRKLYLIEAVPMLARSKIIWDPEVFDAILRAISQAFDDIISKEQHTKPFKQRQQDIFRHIFQAISCLPSFDFMYIHGEKTPIGEVTRLLATGGFFTIACDLAVRIPDLSMRDEALKAIILSGHFDDALSVGFPEERVFELIVSSDQLETATTIMLDDSLIRLTNCMYKKDDTAAIERIKNALISQGRTKEIKRMEGRFAVIDRKMEAENKK